MHWFVIDMRIKFCADKYFPFSESEQAKIRMIVADLLTLI